jgi:hypothetical protein
MGGSGIMGYLIGLNMTAIHITYFNVIKTQAAINLKSYHTKRTNILNRTSQDQSQVKKNQDVLRFASQIDISERANESNSLILYLLFNVLFVLQGIRVI